MNSSIGIIGGADGPTAIFIAGNPALEVAVVVMAAAIGYLLGSLMFGIIVSKNIFHDDVRGHGSGNAGSTNMLRTFGKGAAVLTLIGDMGKGVLAVFLARWAAALVFGLPLAQANIVFGPNGFNVGIAAAFGAMVGHMKPCFFGFKGGKAVAVGAGTVLAANPLVFVALVAVFVAEVAITRIVSLTSITCAACYPVFTLLYGLITGSGDVVFNTVCALAQGALVIWLHRENIQRLRNGTEYKFGEKKK